MIPDAVFTLDKAKAHLRVTHAVEDALITAMLDAAVAQVERITRRAWTTREWRTLIDACDLDGCNPPVLHAELSPATATIVINVNGTDTDLPATDWFMSTKFGHSFITLRDPLTLSHGDEGIVGHIEWEAAPLDDVVPPDVYAAVMLYLGDLYENRESQFVGIAMERNPAADVLLRSYVVEMHA